MLHRLKLNLKAIHKEMNDAYIGLHASNLAFHTLVSFVPLTAVILYSFSLFGNEVLISKFFKEKFLYLFMPSLEERIFGQLENLQDALGSGGFGLIGLISLTILALRLFHHLEYAISFIHYREFKRLYHIRIRNYFLVLLSFVSLLSLLFSLASWFSIPLKDLMPSTPLGIIFLWLIIFIAYQALPYKKTKASISLGMSFVATVFILITQLALKKLILDAIFYDKLYGSFAAIPIALIWLNIFWMIFLTGVLLQVYFEKS